MYPCGTAARFPPSLSLKRPLDVEELARTLSSARSREFPQFVGRVKFKLSVVSLGRTRGENLLSVPSFSLFPAYGEIPAKRSRAAYRLA